MKKWLKWTFLFIFVLSLGTAGYWGLSIYQFANHISSPNKIHNMPNSVQNLPPKWEGRERVNVLLLGGDSRGLKTTELPRSDSIMIASMDPVTKKAYLFSILRDTYVDIPGQGKDRINAAIAFGGPNLAMKTVSNLTGLDIQYYAYTDFQGFIALIDALGGIDIDVEKDMKYKDAADDHVYDIDLKKGMQHLDGKTALQYVRFRHDALSDFSRTERQRKFLSAVAHKMQSAGSLIKLPVILGKIEPYVETNMSMSDMLKLGSLGYEVQANGIMGKQLPPQSLLVERTIGGASVITVNSTKLKAYIKDVLSGADPEQPKGSGAEETRSSGARTTDLKKK